MALWSKKPSEDKIPEIAGLIVRGNNCGISLFELLVLAAIICASVLLFHPALRAGEHSSRARCKNNLRVIFSAMGNYLQDYDGSYVPTNADPNRVSWNASDPWHRIMVAEEYAVWENFYCVAMEKHALDSNVSEDDAVPQTSKGGFFAHYGYNFRYIGGWPGNIYGHPREPVSDQYIARPSETILMTDAWNQALNVPFFRSCHAESMSPNRGQSWPVHDSGVNVLWVDGHVNYVKSPNPEAFASIYEMLGRYYWGADD